MLSGNNDPDGAGDLQEGFEFGWEPLEQTEVVQESGVMAGANVWPAQSEVKEFREHALKY